MSKKKKRYTQEQQQQEQRSERSFNQYIKERKTVNLIPKSLNQEHYIDLLTNQTKNIVFATGPAGTGKTFLAMLAGIKAYKEHQVSSEYYSPREIAHMLDDQTIEISPLAFMRGRTFKGAWVVADEMQNATPGQIKMLLTRLGEGSKIVVTGDTRQADRSDSDNGLLDFKGLVERYQQSKYVAGVEFEGKDIARHPAVREILSIYGED